MYFRFPKQGCQWVSKTKGCALALDQGLQIFFKHPKVSEWSVSEMGFLSLLRSSGIYFYFEYAFKSGQ